MTHFELNQFIALEVEKNPLLEFPSNDGDAGDEYTAGDDEQYGHPQDDAGADDGYDNRAEALSDEWYDYGGNASTSRLKDELDANYDNIFPDDATPQGLDAPELVGQWKSMPGNGAGADYNLGDFVAGQVSLRDHLAQQIPFVLRDNSDSLIAKLWLGTLSTATPALCSGETGWRRRIWRLRCACRNPDQRADGMAEIHRLQQAQSR